MPLTARQLIDKRNQQRGTFFTNLVPQMDYLEALMRQTADDLSARVPRDDAKIKSFRDMAAAMHTVAHSSDSIFNSEGGLQKALDTLYGLPDMLEANNGENLKLMQQTADENPILMNDLQQQDKFKDVATHIRDVNSFCELGYGDRMTRRRNVQARENFYAKMDKDGGQTYRETTAKQLRFLARLYEQAEKDLERKGGSASVRSTFRHYANVFNDLAKRGNLYMDDSTIEARMDNLRNYTYYVGEGGDEGMQALRDTLKEHPELKEYLPEDQRYQDMTIAEHIAGVGGYFDLQFEDKTRLLLNDHNEAEKKEMQEAAARRAENERLRRQDQLDREEANLVAQVREEEDLGRQEDEAERQKEEQARQQAEQERQQRVQQRREYRQQNGAFAVPPQYGARDVAGMFVDSAKKKGPQYKALRNFSRTAGNSLRQWNEYVPAELSKRLPQVMKDLPDQPTEEQRNNAVSGAIDSVSPEEREQHLRRYYPDYEQRLAAEMARLGEGAQPEQAQKNLYRAAVTEQYRDDLRQKTYTADKIRQAQQDAAIELAREQLDQSSEEEKQKFESDKLARANDTIADQVRNQIIEGFRERQGEFVLRQFGSDYSKSTYVDNHPHLRGKTGEELNKALYETRMNELIDSALYEQDSWDGVNTLLTKVGVPKSMTGQNGEGPLDVALKRAKESPIDEISEKDMLRERAKNIPQQEIDRRAEEKLPLPENDDQLIYRWAKDRKHEQLRNEVLREREEKFPEIAKIGAENLSQMHKQAQGVLKVCNEVIPQEGEDQPVKFDYEEELKNDKDLSREQRSMLRTEYKNHLDEARKEQERKLHPKLMIKEDQELKEQMERDAARRLAMSEDEKRAERMKVLKDEREAAKKKRQFRKDWKARLNKAEEKKQADLEDAKNKKLEGKLEEAGLAAGELFGKLKLAGLEGELGKAADDLDKAFTEGDLENGKALREKLGVEADKMPVIKAQQAEEEEPDLDSSMNDGEGLNYTMVEDDVLYAPVQGQQEEVQEQNEPQIIHPQPVPVAKVEPPKPKKPYVFTDEYKQAHKKEQEEENALNDSDELDLTDLDLDDQKNGISAYTDNIPALWNNVKNNPKMSEELKNWHLSTILAVNALARQARKDKNTELLTNDNIEAEAEKIRNSTAYKELFLKGAPKYTDESSADRLMADYDKNVKKIAAYRVPKGQQPRLSGRLEPVVSAMERTGSGRMIKFIPRGPLFGNSTGYKNALAAIKTVKDQKDRLTAEQVYDSTKIVMNYLDGKEKVRTRAFGRERWNDCMTFLKQTMPPDKFKEYCDSVNVKRGVANDPNHKDYVTPESFISPVYKDAFQETMDTIERGRERPEDYATLLALKNMDPDQPIDGKRLAQEKERIMEDENFKYLAKKENIPHLRAMVGEGKNDYKALAQSLKEDEPVKGPQAGQIIA